MKMNKNILALNVNSVLFSCQRLGTLLYAFIAFACSLIACVAYSAVGSPFAPSGTEVTVIPNAALPGVPRTIVIKDAYGRTYCNSAELFYTEDSRPAIYLTSGNVSPAPCEGVIKFTPQVSGALPITFRKENVDYAIGVMIVSSPTNRGAAPVITVVPELGFQNEPRKIIIESEYPQGCALILPTLDAANAKLTGVIMVRVAPAPCTPVSTPNRVEVTYTPTKSGVERIVVVQSDGNETRTLAESKMRTGFRPRDTTLPGPGIPASIVYPSDKALSDITGTWFDPASNGSGLLFSHNFNGTDAVFGTWYMYDTNGNPRWFTIQDVEWRNGGSEFFGYLYETRAASGTCTPQTCVGNSSRAVPSTGIVGGGKVHFVFTDAGAPNMPTLQKAKITVSNEGSSSGPIFSSTLTRLNF
jgi:hypothetical protein